MESREDRWHCVRTQFISLKLTFVAPFWILSQSKKTLMHNIQQSLSEMFIEIRPAKTVKSE